MNRSMSMYADTVFINGVVITVDRNDTVCQAVAVRDKYIVYTGDNDGARLWTGPETRVIDLNGRALLPGFVDAHCHLGMRGQNAAVILDCSAQEAPDIPSIQRIIREEAQRLPKGAWIKATGYDQGKLKEGRHPTRAELDEAAPDNPVQLTRTCLHMGVYNTLKISKKISQNKRDFLPLHTSTTGTCSASYRSRQEAGNILSIVEAETLPINN